MLRRLRIKVRGIVPLMMHNIQLLNPLNPWSKLMKEITNKPSKKRTDADQIELARLEFMGGLYLDAKGEPCIPTTVIEGFFGSAAKTLRKGKQSKAGISCPRDAPLIYAGPRKPDELWKQGGFHDIRGAKPPGQGRVMRTRPIFADWAVEFEVYFDDAILDRKDIDDMLRAGATTHGFGDYIPKFGRFLVESIKDLGELKAA